MKMHNDWMSMILAGSLLLASCSIPPKTEDAPKETLLPTQTMTEATEATLATEPTEATQPPTQTSGIEIIPPAIETKEPADTDMVRVQDYIPGIVVQLRYATQDNFAGKVIYTFADAYLRYGTVKKLAAVQAFLKDYGYGLKIWDAYRPVYGQQALWDAYPDADFVSRPGTGVQAHCRGHAVDITLVDLQGNDVEMPSDLDDFTALGDKDYSDCTETAAYNAALLDSAMRACGFKGYQKEWWHYVDLVNYSIEDLFDPAVISIWYAKGEQSIPLRSAAATVIMPFMQIGRGEMMTVIGYLNAFAYVDYAGYRGFVEIEDILPVKN